LAHSAGELMGVISESRFRDADKFKKRIQALTKRYSVHRPMGLDSLGNLIPDAINRVKRMHGALRYHGDVTPPHLVERFPIQHQKITILIQYRAAGMRILGEYTHDCLGDSGFAAAALANDPKILARFQAEGYAIHRARFSGRSTIGDCEVTDVEHCHAQRFLSLGLTNSS
jgi:hypothetical protein